MSKLSIALIAGLFAVSVNAFAADAGAKAPAKPATEASLSTASEKPAVPAPKRKHGMKHKKSAAAKPASAGK